MKNDEIKRPEKNNNLFRRSNSVLLNFHKSFSFYSCLGILFLVLGLSACSDTRNQNNMVDIVVPSEGEVMAITEAKDMILPKLPALTPNVPFAKSKSEEATNFTPEIRGNSIVAGAKSLSINADGSLVFTTSGQTVTFFTFFRTDFGWTTYYRSLKQSLKFDSATKTFTTIANYPLDKNRKEFFVYTQRIILQPDGLVKVICSWDVPKSWQGDFLQHGYFITWSDFCEGRNIRIDGQDNMVKKNDDPFFASTLKGENSFEIFPAYPADSFVLKTLQTQKTLLTYKPDHNGKTRLQMRMINSKATEHSFLLDFRKSVQLKKSAQTRGNVDFLALEDLELPDRTASRNLLPNPSFEQGLNYYSTEFTFLHSSPARVVEWEKNWDDAPKNAIDSGVKVHGDKSLRVDTINNYTASYPYSNGDKSLRFGSSIIRLNTLVLEPGTYTFSFYAKSAPREETTFSVRFPRFRQLPNAISGQVNKNFKISQEWLRYTMTFNILETTPIGGQLRILDSTYGSPKTVWLDALQLELGNKATKFSPPPIEGKIVTSAEGNFLQAGKAIDARLDILTSKPNQSGKATVKVKDFFGEQLFKQSFSFTSDQSGHARVELPLDGKLPRGIFVVKVEYNLADGTKAYEFHRLSIMSFLTGKHRLREIFAEDYASNENRQDFKQLLERYRNIGIGSKVHLYTWDRVVWECYRKFDVTPFNAMLITYILDKNRIMTNFFVWDKIPGRILQSNNDPSEYGNLIYGDGIKLDDPSALIRDQHLDANGKITDAYLKKLQDATAKLARKKPWVKLWGLGGEVKAKFPDGWWSEEGTPEKAAENHAKILAAFVKGIRQGNPDAKVFQDVPGNMMPSGGMAETDRLLAETNKLGVKFDMIGIHPYRDTPESPDLDADTLLLFKILKKRGYDNVPVFWPEMMHWGPYDIPKWSVDSSSAWSWRRRGPMSYDMGWTEKMSAAWRARAWLVALKYQDRITCAMSAAASNSFDMDLDLTPYANQKISNTLGRLLGNAYFKKDVRFAPYIRTYIFEDELKRPVAAIWCHQPGVDAGKANPPMAEADFNGNLEQVFDLMEAEREFTPASDGRLKFAVSSFPTFYRGKPGTLDSFVKTFEKAILLSGEGMAPLLISAEPATSEQIRFKANNYISEEFSGKLEYDGHKLPLIVPGSSSVEVNGPFPKKLAYDRITDANLSLTIKSDKRSFTSDTSFKAFLCPKAKNEIKIDGNLDDWAKQPAIAFTNRLIGVKGTKVSDTDFSGWFKTAWTAKGFYLAVKIVDDHFVVREISTPGGRWCNDTLQIYFDSLCDARTRLYNGYDENDYDYAVHPDVEGKTAEVFRRKTPDPQLGLATQAPNDNTLASDIPVAFKRTSDGYVYEVFFPAKYLLPIQLKKGYVVGVGLVVNDRDVRDNAAGMARNGLTESALTLTSDGKGCYNNPQGWPAMLLWD